MTPLPLILFFGALRWPLHLLPHRMAGTALPKTPAWYRAGRIVGIAAMLSSGVWLLLDVTLPRLMQRQRAGHVADTIGWGCVLVAACVAVVVIRSTQPGSEADRPN